MGGSHRAWAEGYAAASRHDVSIVSLPAQTWRWRLRGSAPQLAALIAHDVDRHGPPDLLLVSGMVDLSSLLGFTRQTLPPETPVALFLHESQLLYPTSSGNPDPDASLRNWHSLLAADRVFFNSRFHRSALIDALPAYMAGLPDAPDAAALAEVTNSWGVLPVGIDPVDSADRRGEPVPVEESSAPPVVLWPHRWEADKDPAAFLRAVRKLASEGISFQLVLAGEDGPEPSEARSTLVEEFGDRVLALGPFSRADYRSWVARSDVVVSCAHHEFFGIAVAEALSAGCVPVLPNRLSYPELVGETGQASLYSERHFASALRAVLVDLPAAKMKAPHIAGHVRTFRWSTVAERYDETFETMGSEMATESRKAP